MWCARDVCTIPCIPSSMVQPGTFNRNTMAPSSLDLELALSRSKKIQYILPINFDLRYCNYFPLCCSFCIDEFRTNHIMYSSIDSAALVTWAQMPRANHMNSRYFIVPKINFQSSAHVVRVRLVYKTRRLKDD